jgi:N-acyl-D-amino-acid deacylase
MPDLLIQNIQIVDGTGNPAYVADLSVTGAAIDRIGPDLPVEAAEILDGRGLCLSPGFIDIHTHSDFSLLDAPGAHSRVYQGVTTEATGNCGGSPGPVSTANLSAFMEYMTDLGKAYKQRFGTSAWPWKDLDGFCDLLFDQGVSLNIAPLVGHSTLRVSTMGYDPGVPDTAALDTMGRLLAHELDRGAFGLSSGLIYHPGAFAQEKEMASLARVAADHSAIYATHMRSEGKFLFQAVDEAIAVAQMSGVSLEISHLKCETPVMWGKSGQLLATIDQARDRGININFDQYPYTAYATSFLEFFPVWSKENGARQLIRLLGQPSHRRQVLDEIKHPPGNWDNPMEGLTFDQILITGFRTPANQAFNGMTLAQIADQRNQPPREAAADIFCEEKGMLGMIVFAMSEDDLTAILSHPLGMVGSDGRSVTPGKTGENIPVHPRFYGTFPRVLSRYVREKAVISLEQAIRKMTGLPAEKLGIKDRGLIKPKMAADLVLFDPDGVEDRATFANAHQYPVGIRHVFVNGQAVIRNGNHTGKRPGRRLFRT